MGGAGTAGESSDHVHLASFRITAAAETDCCAGRLRLDLHHTERQLNRVHVSNHAALILVCISTVKDDEVRVVVSNFVHDHGLTRRIVVEYY